MNQDIKVDDLTPMMQQYLETKEEYSDCILFYRLGDFYEMFFDDALTASRELEITLTGKSCGLEERAPMCGVPYHAVENYLSKLVAKGYKVAICEQVEDPKQAKGLVKREVVRIVTPGTNLNMQSLEEGKNNYLMCVTFTPAGIGLAAADVTTGDFYMTEVEDLRRLMDELMKYEPSEIICNDAFLVSGMDIGDMRGRLHIAVSAVDAHYFDDQTCVQSILRHFKVKSLIGLGLEDFPIGTIAAGRCCIICMTHRKQNWVTSPIFIPIWPPSSCCWIPPPGGIWNWRKHCVKSRSEVPFCGCWTRPKRPWGPALCAAIWNSL